MRAYSVAISGLLLAMLLDMGLAVPSTAQTPAGSAGQSGSPGAAPSQSSTPSQAGDTSTGATSPASGSGSGFASPRIQPGDYLAPLSTMRWGPFALNSIDTQASWSNQPIGLNGDASTLGGVGSGIATQASTIGSHSSANISARWRWGTGFVGFQYTPSMDYQTATGKRLVNHNLSLFLDHPFRFGKWRLTLGAHTSTVNQFSQFYQPPAIQPLLDLQVPITILDLVGLLSDPMPLQPVTPQLLLLSTRIFSANASAQLSRPINARDSLSLTAAVNRNQLLDFGNGSGALFTYPQSSAVSTSLGWSHFISSRATLSFSLSAGQSLGGAFGQASQQSAQAAYSWRPWRKWAFHFSAGPQRIRQPGNTSFSAAGTAGLSYAAPGGAAISLGYTKGFQLQGFTGGQDSKNLNVTWAAPQLKGHKWHYTLTTNVQLAQSGLSYNGQPAVIGSSFNVAASFIYPVTRHMGLTANYGYFFQDITGGINGSPLQHFQRNLVSAGLHYGFNMPGAARY